MSTGVGLYVVGGLGIGLLILAGVAAIYAVMLVSLVARRGRAALTVGWALGVVAFLAYAVGLQIQRALAGSVPVYRDALMSAIGYGLLPGMTGAWFAVRSVYRQSGGGQLVRLGLRPVIRVAGGYLGGVGLLVLALMAADLYRLLRG